MAEVKDAKRYRYIMEIDLPSAVPPAQVEAMIRSCVSWADVMLPNLQGARIEQASGLTLVGQFPKGV